MSMASDNGSAELSAYWLEILRVVDEGHDLYLSSDPQERSKIRPAMPMPVKWRVIEQRVRSLIIGLLPGSTREQILRRAAVGQSMNVADMVFGLQSSLGKEHSKTKQQLWRA